MVYISYISKICPINIHIRNYAISIFGTINAIFQLKIVEYSDEKYIVYI